MKRIRVFCLSLAVAAVALATAATGAEQTDGKAGISVFPESYALTYQGFPYKKTACENPVYLAGQTVRLSAGTVQNDEGLWLCGWQYQGVTYPNGANFTMPAADVELVPVWGDKPQALSETAATKSEWKKELRNGQLLLIRDGQMYNILGGRVQ